MEGKSDIAMSTMTEIVGGFSNVRIIFMSCRCAYMSLPVEIQIEVYTLCYRWRLVGDSTRYK